ncbi:class A beta-lactamase [Aureimonas jatrophae]|uniref:Beta-lactamase n=1 Tax=Aureimonas jatrophae TaxID=1166073 RepID=A0A1H0MBJ1_9HYPH|nr:class A beta-lactamase [Aureimonas jatrophae]MBB3951138.1 beta-lactamase class A [Aureimonas jatrophae]SDO77773.1 beta-lactamase class A [Aureimonas jatrophae]
MLILDRRRFATLAGGFALLASRSARADDRLDDVIRREESAIGARLGVAIHDTHDDVWWRHRADERFPMCSTFKVLAGAATLKRVERGEEDLTRRISIAPDDIVTYSPVTEKRVGENTMIMAEVLQAALTMSDNTAANILIDTLGGPQSVTAFIRAIGDNTTRLDRRETELNEATPGDPRDTTTPEAMTRSLESLLLGNALQPTTRLMLEGWMVANTTGGAKLRAGLPASWRVGDRTGGGAYGTMGDVAVIWPIDRKPVVASVYITETEASFDRRNEAIAAIGKALAGELGR